MSRREFSAKVKVAAFQRAGGCCEECSAKLFPGNIEYDHRIPDQLGGEPTLDNCIVACRACHRLKTSGKDIPAIARAKRREAAHIGAKTMSRHPMPGSRLSKFKRRMDGTTERRT